MNQTNEKEAPDPMLKPKGLLAALLSLPLFFFFIHLGEPQRGLVAWMGVASVLFAVFGARKDLRTEAWFWTTIIVLMVAQVLLALFVPWPRSGDPLALVFAVFMTIDNFVVYGSIRSVEKLMKRNEGSTALR